MMAAVMLTQLRASYMIREKLVCISASLWDDPKNGAHVMTKGMDGPETGIKFQADAKDLSSPFLRHIHLPIHSVQGV
jgi:hypothetical protein